MMLSLLDLYFLNWFEIANVVEILFLRFLRRLVGLHMCLSLLFFLKNRFADLHSTLMHVILTFHLLSGLDRQFSLRKGRYNRVAHCRELIGIVATFVLLVFPIRLALNFRCQSADSQVEALPLSQHALSWSAIMRASVCPEYVLG